MKYQINEYLNPLFIKASTDFMTESEKAKQQERQRETESEKAEQRERQRARVEWDDSCGRDSAFKKQWDSEIFNINRALDTQPHTSTTSSDLSRRILKIRASYTACKSMKGALQKKAEIAELRAARSAQSVEPVSGGKASALGARHWTYKPHKQAR